ncbi:hypothetical protein PGO_062010 [Plasmodium gonderi]|uniref:Merozoite surface protein 3 n=1 Tax=Plasmodium gonderi TaxID=77519 RepID=A0A1Y1JC31_PLAGO|nr:hypothetical protein PGO_062010 [Plasmodium gonderi]GAW80056.1 hypothetical protein PGO_062010 [Plasmodium gonderi]
MRISGFSIFSILLLNLFFYKNVAQGNIVTHEASPSFRNGNSNNKSSEHSRKKLKKRNEKHKNVRTSTRSNQEMVLGSTGTQSLGSSNQAAQNNAIQGQSNDSTSQSATPSLTGMFARLFLNTIVKPAVNFVIGGEAVFPPPSAAQSTPAAPAPVSAEAQTTVTNNRRFRIELDSQSQTSMHDVTEEVHEEQYDSESEDDDEESDDESESESDDDDEELHEDSDEETPYNGEGGAINYISKEGLNPLLNDEIIHMTHVHEYTDVDEKKEKIEDFVQYMKDSLDENEEFVHILNNISDDMTMYLQE